MERCYDSVCGYENRVEYCEQDARDPDGYVTYVVDAIDTLLYENDHVENTQFMVQVDKDTHFLQRSFSMSHFDTKGWILPLTRTAASITHLIDNKSGRETYTLTLGWAVENQSGVSSPYITQYTIDIFKSGLIQSEMERPNFADDTRERVPITNYDYEQLYEVLDLFAIAHRAERADNLRVDSVT